MIDLLAIVRDFCATVPPDAALRAALMVLTPEDLRALKALEAK